MVEIGSGRGSYSARPLRDGMSNSSRPRAVRLLADYTSRGLRDQTYLSL